MRSVTNVQTFDAARRYLTPTTAEARAGIKARTADEILAADPIAKVLSLGTISNGDGKLLRDAIVESLRELHSGRTPGRTLSAEDIRDYEDLANGIVLRLGKTWTGSPSNTPTTATTQDAIGATQKANEAFREAKRSGRTHDAARPEPLSATGRTIAKMNTAIREFRDRKRAAQIR